MRASVLLERKPSRSTARSEPVLKRQREFAAQLVLALQRLSERATTSNASSLEGCSRPRWPPQHGQPMQDLARNCFDEARRRQCTQCDWQLHSIAREG